MRSRPWRLRVRVSRRLLPLRSPEPPSSAKTALGRLHQGKGREHQGKGREHQGKGRERAARRQSPSARAPLFHKLAGNQAQVAGPPHVLRLPPVAVLAHNLENVAHGKGEAACVGGGHAG